MSPPTITIGILAYPGCLPSSAVIPLDVLRIANTIAALRPSSLRVHFEGLLVSARGAKAIAAGGLTLRPAALAVDGLDALIVPGIEHRTAGDVTAVLDTLDKEREALSAFAQTGRPLASTCSGTCLVASAGLLDGRRCTASWWLAAYFARTFPDVEIDAGEMLVQDGSLLSSGGVTSSLDLALWLVGHFGGDELRQLTAKVLVTDASRVSQAPYVASALVQGDGNAIVERARRWLNQRLDKVWTMAELARHCHSSERTVLRRFQDALGVTPVQHAQQLRVERAKALLESTALPMEEITSRCGYEDVSTFSKIFKRWTAATPREYRQRFGLRR
ncbi:MAG TPA: helix-turn-helix domain-containing protein [Ramlibacter sp.]|nr:helix-turn-helix domain-containing protein [Ramlibacter sp.]